MRRIKYTALPLMALSVMMSLADVTVFASGDSVSVSTDKSSVTSGETVVITVTAYSDQDIYGGIYNVLVNGSIAGNIDYNDKAGTGNSFSDTIEYTASEEGTYSVTIEEVDSLVTMQDGVPTAVSSVILGTASFTATAPTTAEPTTEEPTTAEPTTEAPTTAEPTTETPTTAQPTTETPTTTAASVTGIEATYAGGEKKVGDTVAGLEMSVVAVYSDGSKQAVNGWTCSQVGQPLSEGDNVFIVNYEGFTAQFTVTASASSDQTESSSEESTVETDEQTSEDDTESSSADETSSDDEKIPYIQVSDPFGTGSDLYLASDWNEDYPDGFEEDSITFSGYDVKVLKNDAGIVLAYMTDNSGENGDFYIYDEDTGKFSYYITIPASGKDYYILTFPSDFDAGNMAEISLSVKGQTLTAYQLSDSSAEGVVCLVYAVDEDGNKGYYRFDTALTTFVRYYADANSDSETEAETTSDDSTGSTGVSVEKYNELVKQYNSDSYLKFYIIIAMIILAVVLFAFIIILALKLRKIYNEYDFVDDDDEDEGSDENEDSNQDYLADDDEEAMFDDDFRVDLSGITDDDNKQ